MYHEKWHNSKHFIKCGTLRPVSSSRETSINVLRKPRCCVTRPFYDQLQNMPVSSGIHTPMLTSIDWKWSSRYARFVFHDYRRSSSVTAMLDQLQWASLQERRAHAKVEMMFRIVNDLVDIPTSFLTPTLMMRGHTQKYLVPFAGTVIYQHSFFPDGIRLWNALPQQLVDSTFLDCFRGQVQSIQLRKLPSLFLTHLSLVFLHCTYPAPNKHTVREYANGGLYFNGRRRRRRRQSWFFNRVQCRLFLLFNIFIWNNISVLFRTSDTYIFQNESQFTLILLFLDLGSIYYMDSWVTHVPFREQNNQNKHINCIY